MSRIILSLAGRKRTGKETAHKLIASYVARPEEFQFATPLKKFCMEVFGLTYEQCYGDSKSRESLTKYQWKDVKEEIRLRYGKNAEDFLTARDVLQVIGTDVIRESFYKDTWAEAGIRAALGSNAQTCLFTDTRFFNEIEASRYLSKNDFQEPIIIRLYRDTKFEDEHKSEEALDHFDVVPRQRRILPEHKSSLLDRGYSPVTSVLWEKKNPQLPFDYLLDNNSDLSSMQENLLYILKKHKIYVQPTMA